MDKQAVLQHYSFELGLWLCEQSTRAGWCAGSRWGDARSGKQDVSFPDQTPAETVVISHQSSGGSGFASIISSIVVAMSDPVNASCTRLFGREPPAQTLKRLVGIPGP